MDYPNESKDEETEQPILIYMEFNAKCSPPSNKM
jgi:hypothetical protein